MRLCWQRSLLQNGGAVGPGCPVQAASMMVVSLPGSGVMFYLAAAVSDFYIPASEMPEHKIQSSEGALQVRSTWARLLPMPHCPVVAVVAGGWQ